MYMNKIIVDHSDRVEAVPVRTEQRQLQEETRRETYNFGDFMRLILEVWWYVSIGDNKYLSKHICQMFRILYFNSTFSYFSNDINTYWPKQNLWHFTDAVFKYMPANENRGVVIWIPLKFVSKGLTDSVGLAIGQVMDWRRRKEKSPQEPIRTQFKDAHRRHPASMCYIWIIIFWINIFTKFLFWISVRYLAFNIFTWYQLINPIWTRLLFQRY